MLWDGITTPSGVASSMQRRETSMPSHCTVVLHCWSTFQNKKSTDVAEILMGYLPDSFRNVSMQELIWRLRMAERPEQTKEYLSHIK